MENLPVPPRRPVARSPLARAIRDLRLDREMTQKDVVDRSGGAISPGHLGMVESGQRMPSADMLDAFAVALGLTAEELGQLQALRRDERAKARAADAPEPVAGDAVDLGGDPDLDEVLRKVQEAMDAMEAFKRAHERKERR